MPRIVTIAALALLTTPAFAQPAETCLTHTITGQVISPPMCFTPEPISTSTGGEVCEWVGIASGGKMCVTDRPEPPKPTTPIP